MFSADNFVFRTPVDPIRAALVIAMTETVEEEREVLARFREMGVLCAATMAYGLNLTAYQKVISSVIGMCLNERIVEKKSSHIHPLVHAINEAVSNSAMANVAQQFRFKIAVVRSGNRIALAFYGDLAIHELSSHKVAGTGYQVLGE